MKVGYLLGVIVMVEDYYMDYYPTLFDHYSTCYRLVDLGATLISDMTAR